MTSNLAFEERGTTFPNRFLGAATPDRLKYLAACVLDGDSCRAPERADQPSKSTPARS